MVAVAIDDQAGEAVGLGPDEAGERFINAALLAVLDGLADAAGEEVEIEVLLAAGKAAGDDLRLRIVDGGAERAVAEILERDHVAGLRVAEGFLDFSRVNPLVTVKNACAGCDDNTCHGAGIWRGGGGVVDGDGLSEDGVGEIPRHRRRGGADDAEQDGGQLPAGGDYLFGGHWTDRSGGEPLQQNAFRPSWQYRFQANFRILPDFALDLTPAKRNNAAPRVTVFSRLP